MILDTIKKLSGDSFIAFLFIMLQQFISRSGATSQRFKYIVWE